MCWNRKKFYNTNNFFKIAISDLVKFKAELTSPSADPSASQKRKDSLHKQQELIRVIISQEPDFSNILADFIRRQDKPALDAFLECVPSTFSTDPIINATFYFNSWEIVNFYNENDGYDLKTIDADGTSLLHAFIHHNNLEAVKVLITKHECDVLAPSQKFGTPLKYSEEKTSDEMKSFLERESYQAEKIQMQAQQITELTAKVTTLEVKANSSQGEQKSISFANQRRFSL